MRLPSCSVRRRAARWLLGAVLACGPVLEAQQPTPPANSRQQALTGLAEQLRQVEEQIASGAAGDPTRLQELRQQAIDLQQKFTGLATGFDTARIEAAADSQDYDLQTELMRLLRPLLRALSAATEGPRQIAELQERLEGVAERLQQAEQVQRGLRRARADAESSGAERLLQDRLLAAESRWQAIVDDLRGEQLVTRGRIDALEDRRAPVTETVQNALAGFFQRRGTSLLYAGLLCLSVLLVLRFVHRSVMRAFDRSRRRWPIRAFNVAVQSLVGVFAALSVLLVFYLRGDFELLALAIVFLLGLGWTLSRTLPLFIEELRLLLNAGAVREGERLVVDGLPYRVEALMLHSRLVNPDLQGGVLRLPLRDLLGRASRQAAPDEPWFPSRAGDWVRFADGTFGRVEVQTPEQVIVLVEQTQRTFRTLDYLALNPANLSAGFQIAVPFGIDYSVQGGSTSEIPGRMAQALRDRLPQVQGGEHLQRVTVEFAQAGASSLDLEARAQFGGGAAGHFGVLRRAINAILVDACTEHGWTIPFPQLTLHRSPRN